MAFIDEFTMSDFKKDKKNMLKEAMKYCVENTNPEMACKREAINFIDNLKRIECTISMHNYLGYQVRVNSEHTEQ